MNYSPLGFNTMIYQDPCCGSQIPADTIVHVNDPLDFAIGPTVDTAITDSSAAAAAAISTKKSSWPWWIVIAVGYLYYKEQQGV